MDTLHNDHICTVSSYRSNLSGHTVQAPNPENSESPSEQKIFLCCMQLIFSSIWISITTRLCNRLLWEISKITHQPTCYVCAAVIHHMKHVILTHFKHDGGFQSTLTSVHRVIRLCIHTKFYHVLSTMSYTVVDYSHIRERSFKTMLWTHMSVITNTYQLLIKLLFFITSVIFCLYDMSLMLH